MLYKPLPERNIRLLKFANKDTDDDSIICTLHSALLEDAGTYHALSYVWGPPDDTKTVIVNGETTAVTQNLWSALFSLRHDHPTLPIWIDQLCINQADAAERSVQVAMMGMIYSSAARVLAWLGEATSCTESLSTLIDDTLPLEGMRHDELFKLAYAKGSKDSTTISGSTEAQASRSRAILRLLDRDQATWTALGEFLARPWFSRVWVFQEVAVSPSCTLCCGSWRCDWQAFLGTMTLLDNASFMDKAGLYVPMVKASALGTIREMYREGRRTSLLSLLVLLRSWSATMPQDRVYGVRSLIEPACAQSIEVNYDEDVPRTFAAAANASIIHDHSLAVLGAVEVRRKDPALTKMPCWVPDWRDKGSTNVELNFRSLSAKYEGYYNASLGSRPCMLPVTSVRSLALKGFSVAKITRSLFAGHALHMFSPCIADRDLRSSRWIAPEWHMIWRDTFAALDFPDSCVRYPETLDSWTCHLWQGVGYKSGDMLERKVCTLSRTLLADLLPRPVACRMTTSNLMTIWPAFTAWKGGGFPHPPPAEVLHEYDSMVKRTMFQRRCFVADDESRDAYLGIAIATAELGDWVCILEGGDTPFLLRPSKIDPDRSLTPEVLDGEFVAECYVHGIMNGEAVEARGKKQSDRVFKMEHYYADYERLDRKPRGW